MEQLRSQNKQLQAKINKMNTYKEANFVSFMNSEHDNIDLFIKS